ncbi:MAG: UbiD family decarboxylase [Burkholderiaceae bacterium]
MYFPDLRAYLQFLQKQNQLITIETPVCSAYEITEIHRRVLKVGGPALLFKHVLNTQGQPYDFPVLVNLFGTRQRVAWALGRESHELSQLGEMLAFFRQPRLPRSWAEGTDLFKQLKLVGATRPKTVTRPPCQELIWRDDQVNLSKLPVQHFWPGEPAPLITWGMVITQGPSEAHQDNYNLGIYRMQIIGRNRTIMRWLPHRGGAQQFARWKQARSEPFPVAVVLGADPVTLMAAVIPAPDTISEYQLAGLISGRKTELAACLTLPLHVPANAEIVLEGHVSLTETAEEGPYADHTGYFNSVERFPVFTIDTITMRRDPIYMSTLLSRPPDEPSVISEALNDVFIPLLRQQFPEVVDFWLPPEACSYRMAIVSINKAYPGHARRIMMGIWSYLRQFAYTKYVVIVDEDINVRQWKDVIWAITTRADPVRDTVLIGDTPIDYLDFASPVSGLSGKMGIDATHKMAPETSRTWGRPIQMDTQVVQAVTQRWRDYGIPL